MNRRFGVEIEFTDRKANGRSIEITEVVSAIRAQGIPVQYEAYNHTTRNHWKIVYDSSCGWEAVSPILEGQDGLNQIERVTRALQEAGATVDKKCGLHVHIDATDLSKSQIERIWVSYAKWEKAFDALLPESRRARNNHYCGSLSRQFNNMISNNRAREDFKKNPTTTGRDWGRYWKVNLVSYATHGTVEFRQHSGTIEAEKINNWVILLQQFVNKAIETRARYCEINVKMTDFRYWLGLTRNATGQLGQASVYTLKRFQHFNPTATVDTVL